jgi:hypothetical protein
MGDPVLINHHIDMILEGLPLDYASMVSIIKSVHALIHELLFDIFKKQTLTDAASLNLTHIFPSQAHFATAESRPPSNDSP